MIQATKGWRKVVFRTLWRRSIVRGLCHGLSGMTGLDMVGTNESWSEGIWQRRFVVIMYILYLKELYVRKYFKSLTWNVVARRIFHLQGSFVSGAFDPPQKEYRYSESRSEERRVGKECRES